MTNATGTTLEIICGAIEMPGSYTARKGRGYSEPKTRWQARAVIEALREHGYRLTPSEPDWAAFDHRVNSMDARALRHALKREARLRYLAEKRSSLEREVLQRNQHYAP